MYMKEICVRNHTATLLMTAFAVACAGFGISLSARGDIVAADTSGGAIVNRTIGYVVYDKHWAVYTTENKTECPKGFNDGPREQFKTLFPEKKGQKLKLVDTQLAREAEIWLPDTTPEPYPFYEATGPISYGLNLDGKVGPNDFTSPEGEKGIDNQLYRATGCIPGYRGPDGFSYVYLNKEGITYSYNRIVIELTDVDSLVNDDDVTVTIYHGRDALTTDASGAFLAGGTERVDTRWGKKFIQHFKGKIVNGVLTTEPADTYFPDVDIHTNVSNQFVRGARFKLKLTPDGAEGFLAGYTDVDTFYYTLQQTFSTHHQAYGQLSSPSLYRALHRLADGYPDPKTGANTAISSALELKFVQVFVQHPPEETGTKHMAAATVPDREASRR